MTEFTQITQTTILFRMCIIIWERERDRERQTERERERERERETETDREAEIDKFCRGRRQ